MVNNLGLTVSDYISLGGFLIFILGLAYALWNKVDKNKTRIDYMETDIKEVKDAQKESDDKFEKKIDSVLKQNAIDHKDLQSQLISMNTAIGELPMRIAEMLKSK